MKGVNILIDYKRIMETMLKLAAVPGISGTESENMTCDTIYELITEIPYFKEHQDYLKKIKIEGDVLNRNFVSAYIKGRNNVKKTVIISGHFDVVDVEEYGHLKNIAFDPVEFTHRVHELALDEDAEKDLNSGEWLFGRGTADMKYGIAICVELLREYSLNENLEGNLLFLGVPGEESNSEGMIGAVSHLVELREREGFDYEAFLLPETYIPDSPNDDRRYIHYGACGKIMPLFFFAGKETHACDPFEGLSPDLMAAEVNRLLELNTDFCESTDGVTTPPPTCLKLGDLKELYSVQIPIFAASYYNLVTLSLKPEELLVRLKNLCTKAFNNSLEILNQNKAVYERLSGVKCGGNKIDACVRSYDELYSEVKAIYGTELDNFINNKISEWKALKLDNQDITIRIIRETYEWYPDKVPMIIIAFAPPYYPDRFPRGDKAEKLLKVVDETIAFAKEKFNEKFALKHYYLEICDMSYTGLDSDEIMKNISPNMPGLNKNYILPLENLKEIDIPAVVIGGYGKDCHKYTERLNLPFSLGVIPSLYEFVINKLLD